MLGVRRSRAARLSARRAAAPAVCMVLASPSRPSPFTIIQNSREAIRGAIKDCTAAIAARDLIALHIHFKDLARGIVTQTTFEETGLFPLLDRTFGEGYARAGLHDLHLDEDVLQDAVFQALDSKDLDRIASTFDEWRASHLSHLEAEEKIINPLVSKLVDSLGRSTSKLGELFNHSILSPNFQAAPWFAAWAVSVLAKHGSEQEDPFNAMCALVLGFQFCCTVEQWNIILPEIKAALDTDKPDFYARLVSELDIEGAGKIKS